MFREKWQKIILEIKNFSKNERLFILSAFVCCFCITSEYGISRPASNSIFLSLYTVEWLPYVWLATVPFNLLIVFLYNRFLPVLGCLKIFLITISAIVISNLVCGFYMTSIPGLAFIHSVWKEIYVLMLFQQLWSVIHATVPAAKAKYLYGFIFGLGGVGGVVGGMISATCAVSLGSQKLLLVSIPFCLGLAIFYPLILKTSGFLDKSRTNETDGQEKSPSVLEGIKLIRSSRLLFYILLIVVLMQVASTLIDYQFNTFLQKEYPQQDLRTEFYGTMVSIINICSLTLQFLGSFFLIQLFGLKNTHFLLPSVLACNGIGALFFPLFGMVSFSYATVKSFEYSLFNVIKEMLYVPLKVSEKFHAKAMIDVFAYRSARAFASCLIIALQFFAVAVAIDYLTYAALAICIIWLFIVSLLFKHYQQVID